MDTPNGIFEWMALAVRGGCDVIQGKMKVKPEDLSAWEFRPDSDGTCISIVKDRDEENADDWVRGRRMLLMIMRSKARQ
jgi:hypothetical protein